jgi:hypothetical protein
MNAKRAEKWEKTRRKGQSDFVLIRGGIIFGLLCMGLFAPAALFIFKFIEAGYTLSFFDRSFQMRIIFGLITGFPLGCLAGWIGWHLNEWQYRRRRHK